MIYIGYTTWHNDKLFEFFDVQGIEKTFLPDVKDEMLVDVIQHLTSGKTGDILFLEPEHFLKLYHERSKWNDIGKLISDRSLQLILYRHTDVITDLADQYHSDRSFLHWLNELQIPIFIDGEIGIGILEILNKCDFIKMRPYYTGNYGHFQFNAIKNHQPDKDYFCLMHDKPMRDHRRMIYDRLANKKLLEHGICNFNKTKDWAEDIKDSYGGEYLRSIKLRDNDNKPFYPILLYYKRTWLEIVVETLGRSHDTDTFYCTEKTLKPIGMSHPFMTLACQNHLKNLHELGFKTFGDHIDESYDQCPDTDDRCKIIVDNLIDLKGRMLKFYKDTRQIREHNLKNLTMIFGEYDLLWWTTMTEWWKNFKGGNNG